MFDVVVQMFLVNGYYEILMDVIVVEVQIFKLMLYLYYGFKEDLFGVCLNCEMSWFIDVLCFSINFDQSLKDLLCNIIVLFLCYIDVNWVLWIVMYIQVISF